MIGSLTGAKLVLGRLVATGGVVGGVRAIRAHDTPDFAAEVAGSGPTVPGSFDIIADSTVDGTEVVVYPVQRPNHTGTGLGAITVNRPNAFSQLTSGAESVARVTGDVRTGVAIPPDSNAHLLYGQVTAPGVLAVTVRTVDGGSHAVQVQAGGGFVTEIPSDDAGAFVTANGE